MTTLFPPWLIVIVALITLLGLYAIDRKTPRRTVKILMFIPVVFSLVYLWVWFFSPELFSVSWVVRQSIFFCFGIADYVIFNHLRGIK